MTFAPCCEQCLEERVRKDEKVTVMGWKKYLGFGCCGNTKPITVRSPHDPLDPSSLSFKKPLRFPQPRIGVKPFVSLSCTCSFQPQFKVIYPNAHSSNGHTLTGISVLKDFSGTCCLTGLCTVIPCHPHKQYSWIKKRGKHHGCMERGCRSETAAIHETAERYTH